MCQDGRRAEKLTPAETENEQNLVWRWEILHKSAENSNNIFKLSHEKIIFSYLRVVNFKIFSNHGGKFKIIFSHLIKVISTFSPTMVDNLTSFLPI